MKTKLPSIAAAATAVATLLGAGSAAAQSNVVQIGITDYSKKDVDDFGNYTIVERAFAARANFKMSLPNTEVTGVYKTLAAYRATPRPHRADWRRDTRAGWSGQDVALADRLGRRT